MSLITTIVVKNQTISEYSLIYLGHTLEPSPYSLTLTDFDSISEIQSDQSLKDGISLGDLVLNDGTSDLSIAEALSVLSTQSSTVSSAENVRLSNYTAITDPTVNDDSSLGYEIGSLWVRIDSGNENTFVCHSDVEGAALWKLATNFNGGTLADLNALISDATLDDSGDARTPLSHASSHENGGSDEISVAGLSGLLADSQTPLGHASTHITGGSDEIDGDQIDIDWNPTNYTPTTTPTEVTNVDHLAAHLAGIDTAIGSFGSVVSGPISSTDNAITRWDGIGGDVVQNSGIIIDDSNSITGIVNLSLSGTVDGRDVSVDGSTLDGHVGSTSNPHSTDVANLGSGTLAELNSVIFDATLDDSGDARTPLGHAVSHQNGGSDEISVAGLSGLLADSQTPLGHAVSHQSGGSDEISVAGLSGLLADPQAPLSHAASHENGGSDEISVAGLSGLLADPQAPLSHAASHENGGSDEISVAGLSGLLADSQTPLSHSSGHITGGSDIIDGDRLNIDYIPVNYTRTTSPSQASNIQDLTAHLAGIDNVFGLKVFGDNFGNSVNTVNQTTTSTNFQQALTLSATVPLGTYFIGWFYTWGYNSTTSDFLSRVQLDNSTDLMNQRQEPKDSGGVLAGTGAGTDQRHPCGGWAIRILSAGSHSIDFDYASGNGGTTASVSDVRLCIWRVA